MEVAVKEKRKINPWSQRTVIQIPAKQFKKLLKKGTCQTVQDYQWYVIKKEHDISEVELFDKQGNKINLKQLKQLLRRA